MSGHESQSESPPTRRKPAAGADSRVLDRGREGLLFQPGHRVSLFDRGGEAIDAMMEAIEGAEVHVHLETYLLRDDRTGLRVLDALEVRARQGVDVRVIVDAVGSRELDGSALAGLRGAGGEVVVFNPPSRWLWRFRPRQRDHRKLLIVDGRVAFLGGLNIGDEYVADGSRGPAWRDAHARVEGPSVAELQTLFLENWFRSGGASFDWRSLVIVEPEVGGHCSVAIIPDGPMYRRRRMRDFFLDELQRAQSRVLLVSPYFVPGPRVLSAIEDASDRGVLVELLLAGHTDHPILRRAARMTIPRLLRRGVRVYEDPVRMMHAKLAVFDDHLAIIGTSNLDRQSLDHSYEVNAVFDDPEVVLWIQEHYGTDVFDVRPIDSEVLARDSVLARWIDRLAAFFARL